MMKTGEMSFQLDWLHSLGANILTIPIMQYDIAAQAYELYKSQFKKELILLIQV